MIFEQVNIVNDEENILKIIRNFSSIVSKRFYFSRIVFELFCVFVFV